MKHEAPDMKPRDRHNVHMELDKEVVDMMDFLCIVSEHPRRIVVGACIKQIFEETQANPDKRLTAP